RRSAAPPSRRAKTREVARDRLAARARHRRLGEVREDDLKLARGHLVQAGDVRIELSQMVVALSVGEGAERDPARSRELRESIIDTAEARGEVADAPSLSRVRRRPRKWKRVKDEKVEVGFDASACEPIEWKRAEHAKDVGLRVLI